jgi:hypothetical protein
MLPPPVIRRDPALRINPELSAQKRPFARLHRLRALRLLPWQGQSSRPTSSHFSMAASMPVRSEGSTYRIPFGLRHGSSPSNPLHRPTHRLSYRPSTFSPRWDSVGFPSQRIPRDRRAQPINGTSKLTLVFSPIFLSSPAAFFNLDATGSSFGIRYRLPGLLFHQTSWNLLHNAPRHRLLSKENCVFDRTRFYLFTVS